MFLRIVTRYRGTWRLLRGAGDALLSPFHPMEGSIMKQTSSLCCVLLVSVAALLSAFTAYAQSNTAKHKPDLADVAEGTYFGDVISDSKGLKQEQCHRDRHTDREKIVSRITSNYARLPMVEVSLTQAMGKILNASTDTTFLLDRSVNPPHLDISFFNEVSWAGSTVTLGTGPTAVPGVSRRVGPLGSS